MMINLHPEVIEILQALLTLVLGLFSVTCFAMGWKIFRCPDVVYNRHRDKLLRHGYLTKEEWQDSYRDILG